MAGYKVEICGVNTSDLPLLKPAQAKELLVKIKSGDTQARETFIKGNLRLVLSIVQRFSQSGENLDDLFQIGCIGMIKAIDNFDISLNVQFSTYAVPMIVGEIRRYLRDNNSIRVSRSIRDLAYKVLAAKEKLSKQNGKEPTVEEIAKELEIPKEEITKFVNAKLGLEKQEKEDLNIKKENLEAVLKGMKGVTSEEGGTAYSTFADFNIELGGKTGSAQTDVNGKVNGWFVGFAPYDEPEVAVVVLVENAGSGSYTAEVARDILQEYFGMNMEKVEENLTALPSSEIQN